MRRCEGLHLLTRIVAATSAIVGATWMAEAQSPSAPSQPQPQSASAKAPTAADDDELSPGLLPFQGGWQLISTESGSPTGSLYVDGRRFFAETVHGSYIGTVTVRADTAPAQIDFLLECDCKFDGVAALAIFREDADGLVFVSPAPGEPRPTTFEGLDPARVLQARMAPDPMLSRPSGLSG